VTVAQVTRAEQAVPARRRPSTWAAVAALVLVLGMLVFMFVSQSLPDADQSPTRSDTPDEVLGTVIALSGVLSLAAVGAVLASLRPRNPISWLLLVSGVTIIFGNFGPEYVWRSVDMGAMLPGYHFVDWLGSRSEGVGFALLAVWVPLLFPDGRAPSRRWLPIVWLAAITMATWFVARAVVDDEGPFGPRLANPFPVDGLLVDLAAFWLSVSTVLLVVCIALAFVSVIARFRRSGGLERQQLKWFLAAATVLATSLVVTAAVPQEWSYYLVFASLAFLPIAIGIAILRYRLYDIDRLISRTIGWALLTGILAAVFVAIVLALQALLAGFTQGETLAVAASTLAAFALFQPLRRRIQVAVDRRFDRARYDGQQTVDAFAERLRDEVEFAEIDRDIHRVIDDAVRPTHVGLWLRNRQEAGQ
jgi:hypothetical protein